MTDHDFSSIFYKVPPMEPATREQLLRDLDAFKATFLEECREPVAVRFEMGPETLARLQEQIPRAAEQLRADGWSVAGIPLVLDEELATHAVRVRFSDKSWKIVSVRAGLAGAVIAEGRE